MVALAKGTPFPVIPEMQFYWEPMQSALVMVLDGKADPSYVLQTTSDAITEKITLSLDGNVDK
jgi:maltose-binding protein MalE